jgi:hypothetical protein
MSANAINANALFLNTITPLSKILTVGSQYYGGIARLREAIKIRKERIALSVLRVPETIAQYSAGVKKCLISLPNRDFGTKAAPTR